VDHGREPAIRLCGGFEIPLGGRRVTSRLPGRQGRLLLAYLACNRRRAVTRDELIELLWPGEGPMHPEDVLGALVSKLRRALGTGVLEGRHELTLNLPEGATIDLELAEDVLERGEAAMAAGDPRAAWEHARAALELTDGGLIPGLDTPWVAERRREVDERRRLALRCVAGAGLALGGAELGSAERAARELIGTAPMSELGYRLLMEILAKRGDVAAALQVFDDLRVTLRDELGIAPGPALRALHQRLLAGEDQIEQPEDGGPEQSNAPRREERRLVTALAAEAHDTEDLEDPEDLRAIRAALRERIGLEVERLGGRVEDTSDRVVLALFGVSVAHEDDAERAVRAAFRLRELAWRRGPGCRPARC
jgi:DNA-binding SARP family transcriptional activator